MNNSKPMKSYQFITKYLILLALPMLLSIGSLYAISLLIHRMSMEQKISALNHTLAVAEQGIIEHAEQLLALEVEIFKSTPPMDFEDHKAQLREVWATKVRLTGMLDLIFLLDAHGVSFSSDAERDAKQAERNTQIRAVPPGRMCCTGRHWSLYPPLIGPLLIVTV